MSMNSFAGLKTGLKPFCIFKSSHLRSPWLPVVLGFIICLVSSSRSRRTRHYFSHSCQHAASPSLPLPPLFSQPVFPSLPLSPCSFCLEAAEELNGQSQDEVIMSLYHYILLLPFLVTEKPVRVGQRGTDWLSMGATHTETHTHTPFNPVLCPLSLHGQAQSFPSTLPQSFHDRAVLNGHSHISFWEMLRKVTVKSSG